MTTQREIHVVVGAGQVGTKLVDELLARGNAVRLIRRGAAGAAKPGLTWHRGDATDKDFMDQVCAGASVVYNCANPPDYHRWDGILQPLFRGVMEAAIRAGARLVVLDNLYMVGRPASSPFDESIPMRPCSGKGKLRAEMVEEMFAAHKRGDLRVAIGRASDFFGPETPLSVLCSERFFERLQKGQSLEYMGDPDLPRSYSYTPDVAKGLAVLGASEKADGRVWHLPVLPDMTSRRLLDAFAQAAGHSGKLTRLPKWLFYAMGIFVPMMRGVPEMYYQWEIPYAIDDRAFRDTFGIEATPLDIAVACTLRSALPALATRSNPSSEAGQQSAV